jgi:holo-[acyl-carrier protein] synthase
MGIGIDIVEVSRIERMAEEHEQFLTQHFAARFAAKESVLKALGVGWGRDIKWTDVEIVNDSLGRPRINAYGGVKRLMEQKGVVEILVSLSHIAHYAVASAQLVKGR